MPSRVGAWGRGAARRHEAGVAGARPGNALRCSHAPSLVAHAQNLLVPHQQHGAEMKAAPPQHGAGPEREAQAGRPSLSILTLPSLGVTTSSGRSPHFSSGMAITAASAEGQA